MSSAADKSSSKSAETAFREAFERLKRGDPRVFPKNTSVSQNNVAKEAGVVPSALRKSRFPSLIAEIQRWVSEHVSDAPPSERQKILAHRGRNRSLREQLVAFKAERDHALSLLVEADATILDLATKNADLQARLDDLMPSAITTHIHTKRP